MKYDHANTNEATRQLVDSFKTRDAACGRQSNAATPSPTPAQQSSGEPAAATNLKIDPSSPALSDTDKLLYLISMHPGKGFTALGKCAGIRRKAVVDLFEQMQKQHLIYVQELPAGRGGKLKVAFLTTAARRRINEDLSIGVQGGDAHAITAICAKKMFERAGYHVKTEYPLAEEYAVQLDLMCRHKSKNSTVAVNICMNNAPSYEAQAAYRALHCPEVKSGKFLLIARDRSAIESFKKTLRQLDKQLVKQVELRLAGQVMKAANPS